MKELSDVENKTTDESKDEETEMLTIKDANSDKNRFKKYIHLKDSIYLSMV